MCTVSHTIVPLWHNNCRLSKCSTTGPRGGMIKPCTSENWHVHENIQTFTAVNARVWSQCKLQGFISRTSLQIDMQNFSITKSDLKKGRKKSFLSKYEIQGFIILATIQKVNFHWLSMPG